MLKKLLLASFVTSTLVTQRAQATTYKNAPRHERISKIPKLMQQGQNGYCIMVSAELKGKLKNLDRFIKHKESLGFKVHVVYSNEWGGGKGLQSVKNSTKWLKANYKKKHLLYVLLVGNPNPDTGDLSHAASALAWTDWPYMDLDSDWGPVLMPKSKSVDENYQGETFKGKDTVDLTKINGQWDVLVGRIPWYGEDSDHWKAEDVDLILNRTIRYETEKGDRSWRLNWVWAEHGDGSKKTRTRELVDKFGADYTRLWQQWGDTVPPDGEPNEIREVLNHHQEEKKDPIGFVHYHSHGTGDAVSATISTKKAVDLKDDYPAVHYVNACSVGTPRNPNNIVAALFRFNGIASIGPSMSVIAGNDPRIKIPGTLYTGQSIGESFWNTAKARSYGENGIEGVNKTSLCYYLQGDPSIVPITQRTGSYLQVSPYAAQYDKVVGHKSSLFRKYTVYNNTDKEMDVSIKSSKPWLAVSKSSLTLPSGKGADIVAKVNVNHPGVVYGNNKAIISIASGDLKRDVKYTLDKQLERQTYYNSMDVPIRGHQFNKKDKEQGPQISPMTSGRLNKAINLDFILEMKGEANDIMVPGNNSFTMSFWFKVNDGGIAKEEVDTSKMTPEELKKYKFDQKIAARKARKKNEKMDRVGMKTLIATFNGAWNISITDDNKIALDLIVNRFMLPTDAEKAFRTARDFGKYVKEADDWSDYKVKGADYVQGQWHHVLFSIDREKKKVAFFVNGKKYESDQTLDFSVPLFHVAKNNVKLIGKEDASVSFDEMRFFNYPVSDSRSKAMYTHRSPDFIALPFAGDKRPPNKATMIWKSVTPKAKRILEYAENADFSDKKSINVSGKESYTFTNLENNKTYFWRLATQIGKDKVMSTTSYFITDETVEVKAPEIVAKLAKKPPVFVVGQAGQDFELQKYVKDSPGDKHTYEGVVVPSWATLTSAGIIFTNYGPKSQHLGDNKIIVKVTDQTGQSTEKEFVLKVVNEIPTKSKKKKKKNESS